MKTAIAYMEQATSELVGGMEFGSEADFNQWINNNFTAVIEKARELQIATVEKLFDANNPATRALKKVMAVKIHANLNKKSIQSKANAKINSILCQSDW